LNFISIEFFHQKILLFILLFIRAIVERQFTLKQRLGTILNVEIKRFVPLRRIIVSLRLYLIKDVTKTPVRDGTWRERKMKKRRQPTPRTIGHRPKPLRRFFSPSIPWYHPVMNLSRCCEFSFPFSSWRKHNEIIFADSGLYKMNNTLAFNQYFKIDNDN